MLNIPDQPHLEFFALQNMVILVILPLKEWSGSIILLEHCVVYLYHALSQARNVKIRSALRCHKDIVFLMKRYKRSRVIVSG